MAKPATPTKLGAKAKRYWQSIADKYELDEHEWRILEDICREIDLVEKMQMQLDDMPLVVVGSQGQPVANPLVQELRQHRSVIKSLMASLKLPDEDGRQQAATSEKARMAANARWRRSG